jgi:hypothetical protein
MAVGGYAGVAGFPNNILNPSPPPALERTDFFNGSFIEHRPDGVIVRADGQGNETVCFDGLAWRVDTVNVNNTITGMPACRPPCGTHSRIPAGTKRFCLTGRNGLRYQNSVRGLSPNCPAYTSTLWQDNTYEIIASPVTGLPDIPPVIGQKIAGRNLAETGRPFILQKITADIGAHDVSATAHDDIRTKIDTDLAARDGPNTARPYIRQRITGGAAPATATTRRTPGLSDTLTVKSSRA